MNIVSTSAPGKVIIFGEHAVVYGYPAIAAAIDIRSFCTITKSQDPTIRIQMKDFSYDQTFTDINDMAEYLDSRFDYMNGIMQSLSMEYGIEPNHISILIRSDLWPNAGLGSSASVITATIMALLLFYDIKPEYSLINQLALQAEKIVHGNPSGIDNTVCTYGQGIFLENEKMEPIKLDDYDVLICNTKVEHNTKEAVERVKEVMDRYGQVSFEMFDILRELIHAALVCIESKTYEDIGEVMRANQRILRKFDISIPEAEEILSIMEDEGVQGKITGAGMGGCVIAIDQKQKLKALKRRLKKKGFPTIITKLGVHGVQIENLV